MLAKNPKERLGSIGDAKEILKHPWFADLDLSGLQAKSIESPFRPKLSENAFDVSNFDKQFTRSEVVDTVLPVNIRRFLSQSK